MDALGNSRGPRASNVRSRFDAGGLKINLTRQGIPRELKIPSQAAYSFVDQERKGFSLPQRIVANCQSAVARIQPEPADRLGQIGQTFDIKGTAALRAVQGQGGRLAVKTGVRCDAFNSA